MRLSLLLLFAFLFSGCASKPPEANVQTPTTLIEAAVKEYYAAQPPPVTIAGNSNSTAQLAPRGAYKVLGVSPEFRNDALYVVSVDLESVPGKRDMERLFVRKFSAGGKDYWRAEPYVRLLDEKMKNK